jgi:serralysin
MYRSYLRALAIPAIGATVLGLTATGASALPPDNDLFNRAENITAGHCDASAEGDNVDATGQPGEPQHLNGTVLDFQSVWYKWKSPVTDTVVVDTIGSDYDSILAVYRGRRVGALTRIAADDDGGPGDLSSRLTFEARRGVTYRIAVDSFLNDEGNILLNVTC